MTQPCLLQAEQSDRYSRAPSGYPLSTKGCFLSSSDEAIEGMTKHTLKKCCSTSDHPYLLLSFTQVFAQMLHLSTLLGPSHRLRINHKCIVHSDTH